MSLNESCLLGQVRSKHIMYDDYWNRNVPYNWSTRQGVSQVISFLMTDVYIGGNLWREGMIENIWSVDSSPSVHDCKRKWRMYLQSKICNSMESQLTKQSIHRSESILIEQSRGTCNILPVNVLFQALSKRLSIYDHAIGRNHLLLAGNCSCLNPFLILAVQSNACYLIWVFDLKHFHSNRTFTLIYSSIYI